MNLIFSYLYNLQRTVLVSILIYYKFLHPLTYNLFNITEIN